jgi:hypothetical protein
MGTLMTSHPETRSIPYRNGKKTHESELTVRWTHRLKALREGESQGFTLIELRRRDHHRHPRRTAILVYLGIQNNAKDSAVKSDVSNVKHRGRGPTRPTISMPASLPPSPWWTLLAG